MDAKQVLKALEKRHSPLGVEWAFFGELRAGTGYGTYDYKNKRKFPFNPEQRFDAWAINLWASKKRERIAYEIKVTRSDFLSELKNPDKRSQAMALSNSFYFVAPKGLIETFEIPQDCGLIEVDAELNTRIKVRAPFRDSAEPSWQFFSSIARRACVAEDNLRKKESD